MINSLPFISAQTFENLILVHQMWMIIENGTTVAAPYESVGRLRKKRNLFLEENQTGRKNRGWWPESIDFK